MERVAEGNEGSDGQVPCKSLMGDSTMEFLLGIINNDQVELLKVSYVRCIHSTVLDF